MSFVYRILLLYVVPFVNSSAVVEQPMTLWGQTKAAANYVRTNLGYFAGLSPTSPSESTKQKRTKSLVQRFIPVDWETDWANGVLRVHFIERDRSHKTPEVFLQTHQPEFLTSLRNEMQSSDLEFAKIGLIPISGIMNDFLRTGSLNFRQVTRSILSNPTLQSHIERFLPPELAAKVKAFSAEKELVVEVMKRMRKHLSSWIFSLFIHGGVIHGKDALKMFEKAIDPCELFGVAKDQLKTCRASLKKNLRSLRR